MTHIDTIDTPLLFTPLEPQPADALLDLIRAYREDPRPTKIDLGVGVFRDEHGATPVMRAVKSAEAHLLETQETKSYLGPDGDAIYVELLANVVFGESLARSPRLTGIQTPGGTGALCLGAELIARSHPDATVWIGAPTWPNHEPIFRRAGLRTARTRFYDQSRSTLDAEGMMADLDAARPGDIVLLHGCCHNPSGAVFSQADWDAVLALCLARGLTPFIDLAYQGLGDGLEADALATRAILDTVPEALVAYSCDKNFGLYRERVGGLWILGAQPQATEIARGNALSIAREIWSMPPDHGAAIVRVILQNDELAQNWRIELEIMRHRINSLRDLLAAADPRLASIGKQRGMFALLPIAPEATVAMRRDHGIYMAGNGRINIAGLTPETIPAFVAGLLPHLA